ncbi:MAG: SDR family NAD(P)-dependent oxidoreductase, partial [Ignavibacteriaceae bacterium]|nr:SDR family NAD(P)-dependent oxidoreductase [Ignavibacteriaceae bacterium]
MKRLENKRAIVTGGASGIGSAIVKQFAREGARVIISDIDLKSSQALADSIGSNVFPFELDVTSAENFKSLLNFCQEKFGGLDIFVNNAG